MNKSAALMPGMKLGSLRLDKSFMSDKKFNRTTSLGLIFSLSFVLTFLLAANRQHKGGVQRWVVTVQRPVAAAAAGNH